MHLLLTKSSLSYRNDFSEDFQISNLAGASPDLLWTVNDHAGPFTAAGLIQPVDELFDLSQYVESAVAAVKLEGKTWGVPTHFVTPFDSSFGNRLSVQLYFSLE